MESERNLKRSDSESSIDSFGVASNLSPRTSEPLRKYTADQYLPTSRIIRTNRAKNITEDDKEFLFHLKLIAGRNKKIYRTEDYYHNIIGIMQACLDNTAFSYPATSFTKKNLINLIGKVKFFGSEKPVIVIADLKETFHGADIKHISFEKREEEIFISQANDFIPTEIYHGEKKLTNEEIKTFLEKTLELKHVDLKPSEQSKIFLGTLNKYFPNKLIIKGDLVLNKERYEKLQERLKECHECKRPKKMYSLKKSKIQEY